MQAGQPGCLEPVTDRHPPHTVGTYVNGDQEVVQDVDLAVHSWHSQRHPSFFLTGQKIGTSSPIHFQLGA